jgi:hypothetical protein
MTRIKPTAASRIPAMPPPESSLNQLSAFTRLVARDLKAATKLPSAPERIDLESGLPVSSSDTELTTFFQRYGSAGLELYARVSYLMCGSANPDDCEQWYKLAPQIQKRFEAMTESMGRQAMNITEWSKWPGESREQPTVQPPKRHRRPVLYRPSRQ